MWYVAKPRLISLLTYTNIFADPHGVIGPKLMYTRHGMADVQPTQTLHREIDMNLINKRPDGQRRLSIV